MTVTLPLAMLLEPRYRFIRKKTWQDPGKVLKEPGLGGFFLEEYWRETLPGTGQMVFRYDAGLFSNPKPFDNKLLGINAATSGGTTTFTESDEIDLVGNLILLQMADGQETNDKNTSYLWRTVWAGMVEYHQDSEQPGGDQPVKSRKYFCVDLLAGYLRRWPVRYHSLYVADTGSPANSITSTNDVYYLQSEGHPGYNGRNTDGRILGNRAVRPNGDAIRYYEAPANQTTFLPWNEDTYNATNPTGTDPNTNGTTQLAFQSKLYCHTFSGVGAPWTDLQVAEHVLASSKPAFTPYFYFVGSTDLLDLTSFTWPFELGMVAWDFVASICDRSRGRGLAFLDWTDDTAAGTYYTLPSASFTPFIRINPQNYDYVNYTQPVSDPTHSGTHRFDGALQASTAIDVDLTGDHRNISATFAMGDRFMHVYDSMETLSEKIQVMVNLNTDSKSLTKQWQLAEQTLWKSTFDGTPTLATIFRFDPVWQLFGLNMAWDGQASNGNLSTGKKRVDWRCDDSGAVGLTGYNYVAPFDFADTAPDAITILHDLPIFVGYNYAADPAVRFDTAAPEMIPPDRRGMMVLCQNPDASDTWGRADEILNLSVRVYNRWRIELQFSGDVASGYRLFSGVDETTSPDAKGNAVLSGAGHVIFDIANLCIVCALELPHRLRMKSYRDPSNSVPAHQPRNKVITFNGLHLWLADPNAIYDLNYAGALHTGGFIEPLRGPLGSSGTVPAKIRDDRDRFAIYHALAASWYLSPRRTATWQLRACGSTGPLSGNNPSFTAQITDDLGQPETTQIAYPKLGDLVHTMTQGGIQYTLNTPVTKIHYSHTIGNGVTTWITEWSDLDLQ